MSDAKVLRWARIIQPLIPVEDELYYCFGDESGVSYYLSKYDDADPDRNGVGIGWSCGYIGLGGVSNGKGCSAIGRANGNGRSHGGR